MEAEYLRDDHVREAYLDPGTEHHVSLILVGFRDTLHNRDVMKRRPGHSRACSELYRVEDSDGRDHAGLSDAPFNILEGCRFGLIRPFEGDASAGVVSCAAERFGIHLILKGNDKAVRRVRETFHLFLPCFDFVNDVFAFYM